MYARIASAVVPAFEGRLASAVADANVPASVAFTPVAPLLSRPPLRTISQVSGWTLPFVSTSSM